ncbi:MAG: nucleotide sugar dehydrogenase [Candidatus Bathyarchaeota archaeon]
MLKRGKWKICVVGLGRIGLPHACILAASGFNVIGVDTNPKVIRMVGNGKEPFSEPGLRRLLRKSVKSGKLKVTGNLKEATSKSEVVIIIVPTLVDKNGPDYSSLKKACGDIGRGLKKGSLVILSSTIGPGITETVVKDILEDMSGLMAGDEFGLAHGPIRASSGRIIRNLKKYPRIIAGIDERSLETASDIVSIISGNNVIKMGNIKSAEATKIFENVYRDVNIALANELASFCEKAGLNYHEISEAARSQPFCHLHQPGIVGGKCIPTNPYFLIDQARKIGADLSLVKLGRRINEQTATYVLDIMVDALTKCGKSLQNSRVLILGASFKANVKEDGYSPAKMLVRLLKKKRIGVKVWDPFFTSAELRKMGYDTPRALDKGLGEADCIIIATGHDKFKQLKKKILRKLNKRGKYAIVDCSGHHIFDPDDSTKNVVCLSLGVGKS